MRAIVPSLPLIICADYAVGEDERRLLDEGAGDFAQKPLGPDILAAKIRAVLD